MFSAFRPRVLRTTLAATAGLGLFLSTTATAVFMGLPRVPIDRLIANTSAYIREHPNDPMGPYTLARIHYLAFATSSTQLAAWERTGQLPAVDDQFRRVAPAASAIVPLALSEDQSRRHLTTAVENYRKAIAMNSQNGLFHLGLASIAESASMSRLNMPIPGSTAVSTDQAAAWRELAIAEYLAAFERSSRADSAMPDMPLAGVESLVSYEAGEHYVALVNRRGVRAGEAAILARIQATLRSLFDKPVRFVTPIIFRLSEPASLDDLLDPDRHVEFDLDGTGRQQQIGRAHV